VILAGDCRIGFALADVGAGHAVIQQYSAGCKVLDNEETEDVTNERQLLGDCRWFGVARGRHVRDGH
jgi:hypothetical protein